MRTPLSSSLSLSRSRPLAGIVVGDLGFRVSMHFAGPRYLPFAWIYRCPRRRWRVNEREGDRILHSNPAEIYFLSSSSCSSLWHGRKTPDFINSSAFQFPSFFRRTVISDICNCMERTVLLKRSKNLAKYKSECFIGLHCKKIV